MMAGGIEMNAIKASHAGHLACIEEITAFELGNLTVRICELLGQHNALGIEFGEQTARRGMRQRRRRHEQDLRARRTRRPRKFLDGFGEHRHAASDIRKAEAVHRFEVIRAQHDDDHIEGKMRLEQSWQERATGKAGSQAIRVFMHCRAAVKTLLNHMPTRAELARSNAAPADIGREALAGSGSAGLGIESVCVAISEKQYVAHNDSRSPRSPVPGLFQIGTPIIVIIILDLSLGRSVPTSASVLI